MSWQSYVDEHLIGTESVKEALICGHDGNVWASSKDFNVTAAELKTLIDNMGKIETFQQSGVTMAGVKYMFLSGSDKVIRAKKSTDGLHIMKTTQAVIICKYGEPIVPEQCAIVTEKLGDYFISVGY